MNTPQEFYQLEGKLRRTVYAIIFQDMVTKVTTLEEAEVKRIMKGIKSAIGDAVENSLEFMIENGMVSTRKKRKRGKKK